MRSFLSSIARVMVCTSVLASGSSAAVVDLTSYGSSGTIGGAHFVQGTTESGAETIEPFLRIQSGASERGVNSDGPYTMNEKPGSWTRSMPVSALGMTGWQGTSSIGFLLEINERERHELLSLDRLAVFVAPIGTYNTLEQLTANATLLYDLGAGNKVLLNDALEAENLPYDMTVYFPYRLFMPHRGEYLYLYCKFGISGRMYASDGGYEEWSTFGDAQALGACCTGGEVCEIVPEIDCLTQGGTFDAGVSACDPDTCRKPEGACCMPDGSCLMLTASECLDQSGSHDGEDSVCAPGSCRTVPTHRISWGHIKSHYAP